MRCSRCRTVFGWQKILAAVSLDRATRRYPSPEGVDQDGVFVGGNSSSRRSTSDLIFAMT